MSTSLAISPGRLVARNVEWGGGGGGAVFRGSGRGPPALKDFAFFFYLKNNLISAYLGENYNAFKTQQNQIKLAAKPSKTRLN